MVPAHHPSDRDPACDDGAFADAEIDALFRAYYNRLCGFVYRYVRSHEIAEELVQELFFRLWTQRRREGRVEAQRAYLYTAARNLALNHVKRSRIEARWHDLQVAREPVRVAEARDRAAYEELAAVVSRAIERLPERCRLIYTMSRQQDLTYIEIAAILGLSVKTVEAQMARALRALRASCAKYLGTAGLLAVLFQVVARSLA
jgi:RNA polymerase sigma-70 factor (family 1)